MILAVLFSVSIIWQAVIAKEAYIINGQNAQKGEFPWQVSIQLVFQAADGKMYAQHVCGASLISSTWAVTAGHCIMDDFQILAMGSTDIIDPNMKIREIKRKIVNPNYKAETAEYDIALLELASPVEFDDNTKPIRLPYQKKSFENTKAIISGWGASGMKNEQPTSLPQILQKADVGIFSDAYCKNFYGPMYQPKMHHCIGNLGVSGACVGDSGGPLVVKNSKGWVLAGLTSWTGDANCDVRLPQIYTRVSSFRNWIKSQTGI